jgi:hypothetical protein
MLHNEAESTRGDYGQRYSYENSGQAYQIAEQIYIAKTTNRSFENAT